MLEISISDLKLYNRAIAAKIVQYWLTTTTTAAKAGHTAQCKRTDNPKHTYTATDTRHFTCMPQTHFINAASSINGARKVEYPM